MLANCMYRFNKLKKCVFRQHVFHAFHSVDLAYGWSRMKYSKDGFFRDTAAWACCSQPGDVRFHFSCHPYKNSYKNPPSISWILFVLFLIWPFWLCRFLEQSLVLLITMAGMGEAAGREGSCLCQVARYCYGSAASKSWSLPTAKT